MVLKHLLKPLFTSYFLISFASLTAQEDIVLRDTLKTGINIGIAPLGLIGKFAVSAEFEGKKQVSFGTTLSANHGTAWVGNKAEISLRYYLAKHKDEVGSEGIYAIIQPGIASFKTPYSVKTDPPLRNPLLPGIGQVIANLPKLEYLPGEKSAARGIGFGLGYKRSLKHFFIDVNCRFQRWNVTAKPVVVKSSENQKKIYTPYDPGSRIGSSLAGPISVFAPTLIFGYQIK